MGARDRRRRCSMVAAMASVSTSMTSPAPFPFADRSRRRYGPFAVRWRGGARSPCTRRRHRRERFRPMKKSGDATTPISTPIGSLARTSPVRLGKFYSKDRRRLGARSGAAVAESRRSRAFNSRPTVVRRARWHVFRASAPGLAPPASRRRRPPGQGGLNNLRQCAAVIASFEGAPGDFPSTRPVRGR